MSFSSATYLLDHGSSWVIKAAWEVTTVWIHVMVSAYLKEGVVCPLSKKVIVGPFPVGEIKPSFHSFLLRKAVENVVGEQLQRILEGMNYLVLFHSGFRLRYGIQSAMVMLADETFGRAKIGWCIHTNVC